MIYVAHPFQGNVDNELRVAYIIRKLQKRFPDYTFISGIEAFGNYYYNVEYDKGLKMCLELLSKCDGMLVYGDYQKSKGCLAEIAYCEEHNIPYVISKNAT
jgi:hypothetical protein